jgi:hypothetical protein
MFWRRANRRDCQGTKPESSQETAILPAVPKAHFVVSGICIHISDSRLCAVRAADHRTAENPSEAGRGGATGSHAAVNIQLRIPALTASHPPSLATESGARLRRMAHRHDETAHENPHPQIEEQALIYTVGWNISVPSRRGAEVQPPSSARRRRRSEAPNLLRHSSTSEIAARRPIRRNSDEPTSSNFSDSGP